MAPAPQEIVPDLAVSSRQTGGKDGDEAGAAGFSGQASGHPAADLGKFS